MILGIDLGSTSFKAGLFDCGPRPVWSRSAPVRHRYGPGGQVELDVTEAEAAMRRILPRRAGIAAVAITSQAQTFTAVGPDGRARRPFVSWQDGRAGRACAALRRRIPDFAGHASFADLLPALQLCQLRHRPLARDETALLLPSYFVRHWTGDNVTDDNIAAMSGLYSLRRRDWMTIGVRRDQLPRVAPVGTIAAVTARNRFGLPVGIPVVLAGNDQTAGACGARLEEDGATLITLGTAQVAYRCVPRMPPARPGLIRGPYPGGLAYRMAADAFGGNLINWAQSVLARCGTPARFDALAATSPPGCRGVVFEPGSEPAGGAWKNVGPRHGPGDLARAVLEALTRRMGQMVRLVCPGPLPGVRLAGGGAQSALWRAMLADELGAPLVRADATPLAGAARMARAALEKYEERVFNTRISLARFTSVR